MVEDADTLDLFARPPTATAALAQLVADVVDQVGHTQKLLAFLSFHAMHPEVYVLVERFALQAHRARSRDEVTRLGASPHYGIRMVWERVRWEVAIETARTDAFKLNDHFHALYARLFLLHHPECAGLFALRRLHREGWRTMPTSPDEELRP